MFAVERGAAWAPSPRLRAEVDARSLRASGEGAFGKVLTHRGPLSTRGEGARESRKAWNSDYANALRRLHRPRADRSRGAVSPRAGVGRAGLRARRIPLHLRRNGRAGRSRQA